MKPSRLVQIVNGGRPARVAWKSLRRNMDAELERRLRSRGTWVAVQELLDVAIDRGPSEQADAYLLSARGLLKKLARETQRPTVRAETLGMVAALSIRLGDPDAARKPIHKAIEVLLEAIATDMPAVGTAARYFDDYHERQYALRYLANELMDLNGRFVVASALASTSPGTMKKRKKKASTRKRRQGRGRATVPSWDEILFGATLARDRR